MIKKKKPKPPKKKSAKTKKGFKWINLTKGKRAKVDAEDFERINQFSWYCSYESAKQSKQYAVRQIRLNGRKVKITMHRVVLKMAPHLLKPSELVPDHINGDGLDNRKSNLVLKTQAENMLNAPGWQTRQFCADCRIKLDTPKMARCQACCDAIFA